MRILRSWLCDYVDWAGDVSELSAILTKSGIEVEAIEHVGFDADGVIAARVVEVAPHPNAQRLRRCVVFDGTNHHSVVCGAPNVAADQIVAFAAVGARLPDGTIISTRTIRGVESQGMICSAAELGLGVDHDGILVLDQSIKPGTVLREVFPPDVVVEIGITPNRADALSHFGIARILASSSEMTAKLPKVHVHADFPAPCVIELPEPDLCWRYAARVLDDVTVGPSPRWLQMRLERVGLRPRNVVVDVTNYVMLECGHPLHAFDFDTVEGQRIVVRRALAHEADFVTLDGVQRRMDTSMLCICDANKPLAIAGIMGGANSAISSSTKRVLLESAFFLPSSIRRTAKSLGLQTDASYRFERGADIEMIPYALDRAAALIAELTGARVSERVDNYPRLWYAPVISLRFSRTERILGAKLDRDFVAASLERAGYTIQSRDDDKLTVRVPSYRRDVSAEIDVIEDVAIACGYDAIEPSRQAVIPFSAQTIPPTLRVPPQRNELRRFLSSLGFYETLSFNLEAPETALDASATVEVANALGRERSVLRQWLLPSILDNLSRNARYGATSIRLFEIGKTFRRDTSNDSIVSEHEHLAIAIAGIAVERHWLQHERKADLFDLKGLIDAILSWFGVQYQWAEIQPDTYQQWLQEPILGIVVGATHIGYLAQFNAVYVKNFDLPDTTYIAEITLDALYAAQQQRRWRYSPPSPYPEVVRDVAVVVEHRVPSATLEQAIVSSAGPLLRSVKPFDVFVHPSLGEGKKSIAFRLTFSSPERTLTDDDVNAALAHVIDALASQFNAQLRTS